MRVVLRVRGRVQGVCYRSYVLKNAVELNLKGYVQNMNDGSVEVVAEGHKKDVNQLVSECRTGPALAVVQDIEAKEEEETKTFSRFSVRLSKA